MKKKITIASRCYNEKNQYTLYMGTTVDSDGSIFMSIRIRVYGLGYVLYFYIGNNKI